MGCDIHLFAEVKKQRKLLGIIPISKPKWVSIDKWTICEDSPYKKEVLRDDRIYTFGRCYNLFSALCGVRSYEFNGKPPRISEPKGMPNDCCQEIKSMVKEWDSDGHSHSWNTLEELENFDWSSYGKTCDDFLAEVLPKLKAQKVNAKDVRIVYFFDN